MKVWQSFSKHTHIFANRVDELIFVENQVGEFGYLWNMGGYAFFCVGLGFRGKGSKGSALFRGGSWLLSDCFKNSTPGIYPRFQAMHIKLYTKKPTTRSVDFIIISILLLLFLIH